MGWRTPCGPLAKEPERSAHTQRGEVCRRHQRGRERRKHWRMRRGPSAVSKWGAYTMLEDALGLIVSSGVKRSAHRVLEDALGSIS